MLQLTWRRAAGVLAPLCVALTSIAVAGTDIPAARNADVDHLPAVAVRMYGFVKTPHPGELKWQEIPWLTDLRLGLRQARAEHRPVLLFVSGDDPLEKC